MNRWLRAWGLLLCWGWAGSWAAAAPWSIEELMERKDEWESLKDATLHLEGRIQTQGKNSFRMTNCPIMFQTTEDIGRRISNSINVEIRGYLKKDGNRAVFEVIKAESVPGDAEAFRKRRTALAADRADDHYALARWARQRATFYKDELLDKQGREMAAKGLSIEHRTQMPRTPMSLLELAARAAELEVPASQRSEYIHEALVLGIQEYEKGPDDDATYNTLQQWLQAECPGWDTRTSTKNQTLWPKYESSPVSTYNVTANDQRGPLHRALSLRLEVARALKQAAADGSNGNEIALAIVRAAPERKELAAEWNRKYDDYRTAQLAMMTRAEAQQYIADLERRDETERALRVRTQWLQARAKRLQPDGAIGLVQLARDTWSLTRDERLVVPLLRDALKQTPDFELALEELKALGYVRQNGQWIKSGDALAVPPAVATPMPAAVDLKEGITATQLRQLLGKPTSSATVATRTGITEVWTFGANQGGDLTIVLERAKGEAESRVSKILESR